MPEHVHLLVNEPERPTLSDAIHYLKLSFAKRLRRRKGTIESRFFWQKRYYDRNVRDEREFSVKVAIFTSQSGEAWTGHRTGRVEVE